MGDNQFGWEVTVRLLIFILLKGESKVKVLSTVVEETRSVMEATIKSLLQTFLNKVNSSNH